MIKRILFSLLLALAGHANAATYYFCDNQSGSHASTVAGDDGRSSTVAQTSSTPWRTLAGYTNNVGTISTAPAGTVFSFCKGGAWASFTSGVLNNANVTTTSPLTFNSYTPSWNPTGCTATNCRPLLRLATSGTAFLVGSYSSGSTQHGGYVINGLDIDGQAVSEGCVFITGAVRSLVIEDSHLHRCKVGVESTGNGANYMPLRVRLANNTIDRIYSSAGQSTAAFLGGGTNIEIVDNIFDRNGCNNGFCHHIYFGSSTGVSGRVTVRGNTFTHAGQGEAGGTQCTAGNITMHGMFDQVLIESNTIIALDGFNGDCGGIDPTPQYGTDLSPNEYERRMVIRGNTLVNVKIGINAAPKVLIENNKFLFTDTAGIPGLIQLPRDALESVSTNAGHHSCCDDADSGAIIRYNSFYFTAPGDGSACLDLSGRSGYTHGTGVGVYGNICKFGGASSGTQSCWKHIALSNYATWNRNICYGADQWSTTYSTLSAAQAAGFDANGSEADPLMTTPSSGNNYSMAITSDSSPAYHAGLATLLTRPAFDALGCVRATNPTLGAEDRGASNCSMNHLRSPQWVR